MPTFEEKFDEWTTHFGWESHEEVERARKVWGAVYHSRDAELADKDRTIERVRALIEKWNATHIGVHEDETTYKYTISYERKCARELQAALEGKK